MTNPTIELQILTDKAFYKQMREKYPHLAGNKTKLISRIVKDIISVVDAAEAHLQHPSLGVKFALQLNKVR